MRHSHLTRGDSRALSSTSVRNLFADADWNRLPWLGDETEAVRSRSRQPALPWLIAILVTVASLSYLEGRFAAERALASDVNCRPNACMRVWETVSVERKVATPADHGGALPPAAHMTVGDRELLGQWLLLAETISPGESDAPRHPAAPY